jgi:hypothetical protein
MSTNSSIPSLDFRRNYSFGFLLTYRLQTYLSVQHTCRRFYDVISDSASLQYFLHTEINLLEDLYLPISLLTTVSLF